MSGLVVLLVNLIRFYQIIIVIRIILSWFAGPDNPLVRLLAPITDPLLDAARRAFPILVQGGLDFTPIIIIFLLELTSNALVRLI